VRAIETDILVVGAGASALAYVDALVGADPGVEVVLVDRRHAPGGHWLDAYPFVRLHQPSANYGVSSRPLGADRIDGDGPNAGLYERATGAEICDYFRRVLEEDLAPTGRVRFLPMTEHVGTADGTHRLVSLVSGEQTEVTVRRRLVDATYVESSIPSRHRPTFGVDDDVAFVPPNDLARLGSAPRGFTVIGGGKTSMDTCAWLLEQGVDPDRIRWIRPTELWLFNRAKTQPLDLVASYMQLQAAWLEASANATDALDFARRLEDADVFHRIDPSREATRFRGATASAAEVDLLRSIEDVRAVRATHVGARRIATDDGEVPNEPGRVVVDCTAVGLRPAPSRRVFDGDRTTLQYVTLGYLCWSAALLGVIEAAPLTDEDRNRLSPPVPWSGRIDDVLVQAHATIQGMAARMSVPEVAAWDGATRLNPASGVGARMGDPQVAAAVGALGTHVGGAFANLARLAPLDAAPAG